jgi:hypothetical protein
MKQIIKVGDIFEIPLSEGRKAFGHYLYFSKKGPLVQIYNIITEKDIEIQEITKAEPLFPPVITGLHAAIKAKMWRVIGHIAVVDFVHPFFVSTLYNEKTGKAGLWFLWDGQKDVRIGSILPEKYKNLEFLIVWNPKNIERRIETGEMPYPYRDLIRNNEFVPRELNN